MQNKIPCTAERLGLLDPQMIRAISNGSAFQIARKYFTEGRIRIVEADDARITSTLIGNSGLYEQMIHLKDGHLISRCSCTLPEAPMCRHCIAVLLEYYRCAQPRQSQPSSVQEASNTPPPASPSVNGKTSSPQWCAADLKLSDVMRFMEWLQPATKAIQTQGPLPDPPALNSNEVSVWIRTIRSLAESRRESEQVSTRLKAEIRDRETHVQRLTQELQISMDERKAAQVTRDELRLKIASHEETLAKVEELATELATYEEQMRVAGSERLQERSQFEKLAGAVKETVQALKAAVKPTPS